MKVLLQEWYVHGKGCVSSISKDETQLAESKKMVAENNAKWPVWEPTGEPVEVAIPDDHPFADMVKNHTVFLHDDEMDAIEYA